MNDENNVFDEEDMEEEFDIIVLTDEETGEDIEFAIIDRVEKRGESYILAVECAFLDDEESEAIIFKQDGENIYSLVEDDNEFNMVAALFQERGDEYDVEY
ncbi:MAG: DUF1292 domain-containing protein [Firmicutes bacterium]|nr:DUF1292 domain-containing protein [Bacillota bacterium]